MNLVTVRKLQYGMAIFALGLVAWIFPMFKLNGNPTLHTNICLISGLLSLFAGCLALVRYYAKPVCPYIVLGVAYIGNAILEIHYAFSYSFFDEINIPSSLRSYIQWGWFFNRFFLAGFVFFGWLSCFKTRLHIKGIFLYFFSALLIAGCILLLSNCELPNPTQTGILSRPLDLVPGFLFVGASIGFLYSETWKHYSFAHFLILSLFVNAAIQLLFIPFSQFTFDQRFMASHFLRVLSHILVVIGLLFEIYQLYHDSEHKTKALLHAQGEVRKKNRMLEKSNEELEQYAYIASHDLTEPLRTIGSFTELLIRKCNCEEISQEYADTIRGGVLRMKQVINDLLIYNRIDKNIINFRAVDINEVVQDALLLLKDKISDSRADIDTEDLPQVRGNYTLIKDLFIHLLNNSIKFKNPQVPLFIRIKSEPQESFIKFSVKDNGIGIDEKYKDKIFVIFQRLHNREKYAGTGIGLSISKKIVELHGGKIWFESGGPEQGTTFCFTLPRL